MKSNVILFLTSPTSWNRSQMCLTNFKQLEKLGYDIITLTTSDSLPEYIYDHSKMVIHDYGDHKCRKKYYQQYAEKTGGLGYYFWNRSNDHYVRIFQETYFPSVLRNNITLVNMAQSFEYVKYFYIEDDHYIHDSDLCRIHDYFDKLNDFNDLIFFSFKRDHVSESRAYCSYMHFGKLEKMSNLMKNFAYTEDEFIKSDSDIYMHFYETIFYKLVNSYKTDDLKILEVDDLINTVFRNSDFNKIYSYHILDDDSRCNLIYNHKTNSIVFYYTSIDCVSVINIKLYIDGILHDELNLSPSCWYVYPVKDELVNKTEVVINNSIKKSFKTSYVGEIIYNGELFQ